MKKGYCDITVVVDRSGSMSCIQNEVIGGFNNFLKEQKEVEGEASLTLVQFDDRYELNFEGKDIQDVPDLNVETYQPRGMTAMYDAIGKTINATGKRLADMDESDRPEKVVFLIQTDGAENASKEFTSETVKRLIKEQTDDYSWDFVFLGANIDSKATAGNIGIHASKAMNFAQNSDGANAAYTTFSSNLRSVRVGSKVDMTYEKQDYDAQKDAGASN